MTTKRAEQEQSHAASIEHLDYDHICVGHRHAGALVYIYISNTTSPYDEVGIELNSRMPYPLRKYGCGKLQATFMNALPPYGCGDEQGRWI